MGSRPLRVIQWTTGNIGRRSLHAIIGRDDLELVVAGTNDETSNPLWHGEIDALNRFYRLPSRPPTPELVFLSSHEPCTLCLSAITWAGFPDFYYFFSHEDSRDDFAIPHDLAILKEVFGLDPGGYRRTNAFWTAYSIQSLIDADVDRDGLSARADAIRTRYGVLSQRYQDTKADNDIPLA